MRKGIVLGTFIALFIMGMVLFLAPHVSVRVAAPTANASEKLPNDVKDFVDGYNHCYYIYDIWVKVAAISCVNQTL